MRVNPVFAGIAAAVALYMYRRHQHSKLPDEERSLQEVSPVLPVIVGVAVWGAVQVFNDCKCPGDDIHSDFESGLMNIDEIERLDMQQPAAYSKMQEVYDDIWQ